MPTGQLTKKPLRVKISGKSPNIWKSNIHLNNPLYKGNIKKGKYFEMKTFFFVDNATTKKLQLISCLNGKRQKAFPLRSAIRQEKETKTSILGEYGKK